MIALYSLMKYDPTLFDNLVLPDGIDPETVTNNIAMKYGELEPLYTDPTFLKSFIGIWSKAHLYTWETLSKTLDNSHDIFTNIDTTSTSNTDGKTENNNQSFSSGTASGTDTTSNKVYGYNNLTSPADDSTSVSTNESKSNNTAGGSASGSTSTSTSTRTSGRTGITAAEAIKQARASAYFSIYDYIADDFRKMFLLSVY